MLPNNVYVCIWLSTRERWIRAESSPFCNARTHNINMHVSLTIKTETHSAQKKYILNYCKTFNFYCSNVLWAPFYHSSIHLSRPSPRTAADDFYFVVVAEWPLFLSPSPSPFLSCGTHVDAPQITLLRCSSRWLKKKRERASERWRKTNMAPMEWKNLKRKKN